MYRSLLILGVTGPIGCGKSTVARLTMDLGALTHIDADVVAHELMRSDTPVSTAVAEAFGEDILWDDGSVNRRRLGELVFADAGSLKRLEKIVHPAVRLAISEHLDQLAATGSAGVVTIEAIKLLQSPLVDIADQVWVVACSPNTQRDRLTASRELSPAEVAARVSAQPPFDGHYDIVAIANDDTPDELSRSVEAAWCAFLAGRPASPSPS